MQLNLKVSKIYLSRKIPYIILNAIKRERFIGKYPNFMVVCYRVMYNFNNIQNMLI